MKSNIPPFHIGQKVMYITGKNMPKDSMHIVKDIYQSECGCWSMTINNEETVYSPIRCKEIICMDCGKEYLINSPIKYGG